MLLANIEALSDDGDGNDGGDNQTEDLETQRRRQECFSNYGIFLYFKKEDFGLKY